MNMCTVCIDLQPSYININNIIYLFSNFTLKHILLNIMKMSKLFQNNNFLKHIKTNPKGKMVKRHAKYIVIHYLTIEICEAHQTRKSNKSIASTARKKVQELIKPEPRAKWSEPKIDTIKAYQLFSSFLNMRQKPKKCCIYL